MSIRSVRSDTRWHTLCQYRRWLDTINVELFVVNTETFIYILVTDLLVLLDIKMYVQFLKNINAAVQSIVMVLYFFNLLRDYKVIN